MKRIAPLAIAVCCFCLSALMAQATVEPSRQTLSDGHGLVRGGRPGAITKTAVVDTQLIMGPWGSGAPYNGQFQLPDGDPAWNGWSSNDLTRVTQSHWHVDPYHAVSGNYSAWCGDASIASCGEADPDAGGYGDDWNEVLEWRATVADPSLPCVINISATVSFDIEPSYDRCYLSVVQSGLTTDLWTQSGVGTAVPINHQATYLASDYGGPNGDEVIVQFRFESDEGWSDEDCNHPTAGAVQLDDVQFGLSNGNDYSHDFEDGTLGELRTVLPQAVGNFAKIWPGLRAPSGMASGNPTPMAAFIDDGLVLPGTNGTDCITWCYGPGGYIVNNTGGLAGSDNHLHNALISPVMAWPGAGYDGAEMHLDVWRDATFGGDSPLVVYSWDVRSTSASDPGAIQSAPWQPSQFFFFGSPAWLRQSIPFGDRLTDDSRWVQVRLTVQELGFLWHFNGTNGTPAPYFDNVRVTAFSHYGPAMSASAYRLPHDSFPASGSLDLANLGHNNVRFDMGGQAVSAENPSTAHGDSVIITVKPVRAGATVVPGSPRLIWHLKRNPLFDPFRIAGLPDEGSVAGWPVSHNGSFWADRFAFDLPDSGFLFPGDILHYYFEATDSANGVQQTVTLPADTTGFSVFGGALAYSPTYSLQALPSLTIDPELPGAITQPKILFWDDAGNLGNRDEWFHAFNNLGLVAGLDYDVFFTKEATRPAGQGLGGFATTEQLANYNELIYSSGILQFATLTTSNDGNEVPAFDDIGLLTSWLQLGGKDMLLTGDNLAGDLGLYDPEKTEFLHDWMGVDLVQQNAMVTLGTARGPLVSAVENGPVFHYPNQWSAVSAGELPTELIVLDLMSFVTPRQFNGVSARPGAQLLAEFLDPVGQPGQYSFSAATLNERADYNARVISLPYDFQSIWDLGNSGNKRSTLLSRRGAVLGEILGFFGLVRQPTDVPDALAFGAHHYPNPFNPMVTISYTMPRAGHLSVKVFDVRGRLVDTVADSRQAAGPGEVQWNGQTASGEAAAAGVYFYEARAGDEVVIGKMALIK